MENTVSTTLDDISQKLTTLTEEIQNLPREDADEISRKVRTGKTCPYRRAILWTALVAQLMSTCFVKIFAQFMPDFVRFFFALFTYIGVFLAGEIIIYRILDKKDSSKANAEAVREKYHMTLSEMDIYIRKLGNVRILATIVAFMTFVVMHLYPISNLTVWLAYALTTFASIAYLRVRGKIKTPQRFFLFDLPLKPVDNSEWIRKESIRDWDRRRNEPSYSGPSMSSLSNYDLHYKSVFKD